MAQPSDIKNVIPGQDAALAAQNTAPLQLPQSAQPSTPPVQAEPEFDLSGLDAAPVAAPEFDLSGLEDQVMEEAGPSPGASAWTTLKAGLARTPKQQEAVFANAYGADNVKVTKDKILFRNAGEKTFRSVKPDDLSALGGLFQSLLENSGTAIETGLGAIGGAIGGVAGGIVAPGAGAVPGAVLGAQGGGMIGSGLRDVLLGEASNSYVDPSVNPLQNAIDAGTEQMAGELGGNVLGAGAKALGAGTAAAARAARDSALGKMAGEKMTQLFNVLNEVTPTLSPMKQAQALSEFQDVVKNTAQSYGIKETPLATVKQIQTHANLQRTLDGKRVELAEKTVAARAREQKFQTPNLQKQFETVLNDYVDSGQIVMKDGIAYRDLGDGRLGDIGIRRSTVPQGIQEEVVSGSGRVGEAFAQSEPIPRFLQQLAIMNNNLRLASEQGGVGFQKVLDDLDRFGRLGAKTSSEGVEDFWNLQSAARKDRNEIMAQVLTSDADRELLTAHQAFSSKIDTVKDLQKQIRTTIKKGNADGFFGRFIQNASPENVRLLRESLSIAEKDMKLPENYTIDLMKGEAIRNLFEKHMDGDMILNGRAMNEDLLKLYRKSGDLFSPKEIQKIKKDINEVRSATKFGLRTKDAAETPDKLISLDVFKEAPVRFMKWMYSKYAKDVDMADYILGKGLDKAPMTQAEKNQFLEWASLHVQDVEGIDPSKAIKKMLGSPTRQLGAGVAAGASAERTRQGRQGSLEATVEAPRQ